MSTNIPPIQAGLPVVGVNRPAAAAPAATPAAIAPEAPATPAPTIDLRDVVLPATPLVPPANGDPEAMSPELEKALNALEASMAKATPTEQNTVGEAPGGAISAPQAADAALPGADVDITELQAVQADQEAFEVRHEGRVEAKDAWMERKGDRHEVIDAHKLKIKRRHVTLDTWLNFKHERSGNRRAKEFAWAEKMADRTRKRDALLEETTAIDFKDAAAREVADLEVKKLK